MHYDTILLLQYEIFFTGVVSLYNKGLEFSTF